jgi:tetratricopeptide (TPR) repeat protein
LLGTLPAQTETWRARYAIDRAHNVLLDHLVTEGLVGAGLYALLVGTVLAVGISRIRASAVLGEATIRLGALAAFLAHLADGQVGIATSMSLTLGWLAAALVTSGPWRESAEPSTAASRQTPRSTRRSGLLLGVAASLAVLVCAMTTRWLLSSVAYAEGTRHAIAGRAVAANQNFRNSVDLAPWLALPADAFASTALQVATSEPDASRRLGILHEADAALARARGYAMSSAGSWTLTAQVAFAEARAGDRSRLTASREAFAAAARLRPGDPKLLAQWGWVQLESGDAGEARRIAEQALARDPREWLAWAVLARSAREMGDPTRAETAAAKARALVPPQGRRVLDALVPP